jgi:hypothetical protein
MSTIIYNYIPNLYDNNTIMSKITPKAIKKPTIESNPHPPLPNFFISSPTINYTDINKKENKKRLSKIAFLHFIP